MALGFLALSGAAIGGIIAGVVVLIIIVAVLMRPKKDSAPSAATPTAKTEPRIETSPNNMPSMVAPVREAPEPKKPTAQVPKAPEATPPAAPVSSAPNEVVSTSGRVIAVPTELPAGEPSSHDLAPLEPSATVEAPMLAEASLEPSLDDMKMGTDELPRTGTGEMARVGTREMQAVAEKPRYRTPAAQQMQEAIETMKCPKCGQPTFVGRETPEELSGDGVGMFKLEGRCGACGHKAQVIDMRVG